MERYEHWLVCLDLTNIDDVLIGYSNFLTTEFKPKKISFMHVIKSTDVADEMIELFPELDTHDDVEAMIRKELQENINKYFNDSEVNIELIIKTGRPTDEIVKSMESLNPDLTVMGKKSEYTGKGVIPRRIMKYVPSSILFVPETSRYQLDNILIPVDFSEQSAKSIEIALQMSEGKGAGKITAQHVYNYPSRFFPYLPEKDEEEKMDKYLNEKRDAFIDKHKIPDRVDFTFTLNVEGTKMDQIYDQVVHDQSDLIVGVSKADKSVTSILREDFTDKLAYYRFGVPLLLHKNKEKHQKFLKSLFK